jgi:membrane protease YdiL (CAAX protease family)
MLVPDRSYGAEIIMTAQSVRPPWGFLSSIGWALLALAMSVMTLTAIGLALHYALGDRQSLLKWNDIIVSSVTIGTLVLAARFSRSPVMEYLGLVKPRGRYVVATSLCLVFTMLFHFAHGMHFDVSRLFSNGGFRADEVGVVIIHFIGQAVAVPLMQELMFRGFLYRGLSSSRLGVAGAIIITSLLWALWNYKSGVDGVIGVAVNGAAFGWLRWYTGSTLMTIACSVAGAAFLWMFTLAALYG